MTDIFTQENIFLNESCQTKLDVFKFIAKKAVELQLASSENEVFEALECRENQASTGMQDGIAIPHAISKAIKKPAVIYISLTNKILDWETFDDSKVDKVLAMMVPENGEQEHLQIISNFATSLIDDEMRNELNNCQTKEQVYHFFEI